MSEHEANAPKSSKEAELQALKERMERELKEFEEKQKRELEEFERGERKEIEEFEDKNKEFEIRIDRNEFKVKESHLTGHQLRLLPTPHIGPDRDLFEVVVGGSDLKIENDQKVKMRDGLRFFTAPAQINPGSK